MRGIVIIRLSFALLPVIACIQAIATVASGQEEAQPSQGIWEASNGKGGAVGLNLWQESSSLFHGGAANHNETPHPVLQIGIYERAHAAVRCGEENFFDTGWRGHKDFGVKAELIGEHLVVTYPQFPRENAVDLDLWWNTEGGDWKGRFHRGSFDHTVTLHRMPDRMNHDQELCIGLNGVPK